MTKQQIKQYHQVINRKCRLFLVASLSLVIILSLVKIAASNQSATFGQKLAAIKQETNSVREQNLQIKSQLAIKTGGLNELSQQALDQGYIDKPTIKYLNFSTTVAQKLP
ncbi:MAG: hypothetical protein U0946_02345 [Patescibacteria group bacterium]|nr:hypothetical protein [Patescibacteria group bacterium]